MLGQEPFQLFDLLIITSTCSFASYSKSSFSSLPFFNSAIFYYTAASLLLMHSLHCRIFPSTLLLVALTLLLLFSLVLLLLSSSVSTIKIELDGEEREQERLVSTQKKERDSFNKRKLKETVSPALLEREEGEKIKKLSLHSSLDQLPSPPVKREPKGYVIIQSLSSSSLSSSLSHLLMLQCWAKRLQLDLVEPAISSNSLSTTFPRQPKDPNSLSLDTVYDLSSWDSPYERRGTLAPFVGIGEVEVEAAKEVLVVDVKQIYNYQRNAMDNMAGCMNDSSVYRSDLHLNFGLSVTQEICLGSLAYSIKDLLNTVEDFVEFLQKQSGTHRPDKKTVVLFRNLDISPGMPASDPVHTCENIGRLVHKIRPSKRIMDDARSYTDKVGGARTAIVLTQDVQSSPGIDACYERILTQFHSLIKNRNASSPYLAMSGPKNKEIEGKISFKMFFRALYGSKITPSSWRKKVLLQFASIKHDGYLSVLSQIMASESKCLILTSPGDTDIYANVVERWYKERYTGDEKCIGIVEECFGSDD